jgi:hypothetical protein
MNIVYQKKFVSHDFGHEVTVAEFPPQKRLINVLYGFRHERQRLNNKLTTRKHYIALPRMCLCHVKYFEVKPGCIDSPTLFGWIDHKPFDIALFAKRNKIGQQPADEHNIFQLPLPNIANNKICEGPSAPKQSIQLFNDFWLSQFNFDITANTLKFFETNFKIVISRDSILQELPEPKEQMLDGFQQWEQKGYDVNYSLASKPTALAVAQQAIPYPEKAK